MSNATHVLWTAPSGVPETCFPQYIISLTADPTVTLTVDDTTASSAALNAAGFPYCVSQGITVTPIVAITNTPLTSSSATMNLVVNDPGMFVAYVQCTCCECSIIILSLVIGIVTPSISVTSTGLSATISWEVCSGLLGDC